MYLPCCQGFADPPFHHLCPSACPVRQRDNWLLVLTPSQPQRSHGSQVLPIVPKKHLKTIKGPEKDLLSLSHGPYLCFTEDVFIKKMTNLTKNRLKRSSFIRETESNRLDRVHRESMPSSTLPLGLLLLVLEVRSATAME